MDVFKNVYFHKLEAYQSKLVTDEKTADTEKRTHLDSKQLNALFDDIINNKLKNNCIVIKDEVGEKNLEIISSDENYIFAKLGKYQSHLTVQLRNKKTFEPKKINKTVDQELEIYTYLLIDRDNFVISFLKESSAPSIHSLKYLIDNNYSNQNIYGKLSGVLIDDAVPLLKKKDIIGTISYDVTVPSDQILSLDNVGLSQKEFLYLRNQKHVQLTVKLVAERNKSAFDKGEGLENVLGKIMKKTKKVKIKAKNNNEYMQTYDIVDSLLTKRVKFEFKNDAEQIDNEIFSKIKITYETNKRDIVNYIRKE